MINLRNLEYDFCNRINSEDNLSADIIRCNNYIDIVRITSIKTGQTVSVNFDFVANRINFWNCMDEEFSYSMNEQEVEKVIGLLYVLAERTFYFQVFKGDQKLSLFIKNIAELSMNSILEKTNEILPYIDDGFDFIKVTNFLGNYNYQIDSDYSIKEIN